MKYVLTICMAFIAMNTTFAQEKQNDATWEETVSFLEENIGKFSFKISFIDYYGKHSTRYRNHKINSDRFIRIYRSESEMKSIFDLNDLLSASITNDKYDNRFYISLKTKKNSVKLYADGRLYRSSNKVDIDLCNDENNLNGREHCKKYYYDKDDEIVQRITKAFKHLAYLANVKRKKSKF